MRIFEFRFQKAAQPITDTWQRNPVAQRHATLLGISFRPLQAAAFHLDVQPALRALLAYPFEIIRLGAYWNQIEPDPGAFIPDALDWQIELAEQAGKKIIVCVGPIKTFGYPEFFVPSHRLPEPFPEHRRVKPSDHPALLRAAADYLAHLVERYRNRESILAWQLEHEALDPLGVEHSWRLDAAFIEQEIQALRGADPTRPLLMNGFLPSSLPVRLSQWWNTRDQGDSLAAARRLADMVGVDDYPRNALLAVGSRTLYLDGSQSSWPQQKRKELLRWAQSTGKRLLVTEGQAEPWETITAPPNPRNQVLSSCRPEHVLANYNRWMDDVGETGGLYAYLFWGAEYWLLRKQSGDGSYLKTFTRILE